MRLRLLAFAQARDALGWSEREAECAPGETPRAVLARVAPGFSPEGVRVAVDQEYHGWDAPLADGAAELAILPPVSGG